MNAKTNSKKKTTFKKENLPATIRHGAELTEADDKLVMKQNGAQFTFSTWPGDRILITVARDGAESGNRIVVESWRDALAVFLQGFNAYHDEMVCEPVSF